MQAKAAPLMQQLSRITRLKLFCHSLRLRLVGEECNRHLDSSVQVVQTGFKRLGLQTLCSFDICLSGAHSRTGPKMTCFSYYAVSLQAKEAEEPDFLTLQRELLCEHSKGIEGRGPILYSFFTGA